MKNFNKFSIVLIGVVANIAIVQPTAVFARYAQFPSAPAVAGTKAEDFLMQGNDLIRQML